MSFLFNCCSQNAEGDYLTQDIETETKISGKDRILRLNQQEYFSEYTKYFKTEEEKNIFENDTSTANDIFNLNKNNQLLNIKNSNLCVFCGGENCKYEDPSLYKNSAIRGLISDLFYDCIYASQRPSTALIKKYDLINSFKNNNIKLIVNCEIHGEHPNCGPNRGLEFESGYAYSPSLFIAENIDVLNCGYEEMTAPFTLDFMIDIVKKIAYVIKYENGRVLVHCHSGNGRTCLVIVCFLIYYFNLTAEEAIKEVRKKREKAINNDSQEEYCHKFEIYVNILKTVFTGKQIPIENHIKNQIDLDFNINNNINIPYMIKLYFNNKSSDIEANNNNISPDIVKIKCIPKILMICLDKIIQLKINNNLNNDVLYSILNGMNQITKEEINELGLIKKKINKNNWDLLTNNENLSIITELLFSWINENVKECISPKKINRLWNKCSKIFNNNINSANNTNNTNSSNDNTKNNSESTNKNNFEEFMRGNYPVKKNKIYEFMNIFKIIFSKTECEIIKYISIFLTFIYPRVTNEKKVSPDTIKEYKRFLFKFCFFLLGYNLDKVNALSDNKNLKEMNDVKKFILILEFFIFYSRKDEKKETNSNDNYFNNDWLANYLALKNEYESYELNNNDDIMLFLNEKPKIDFISVKYFFLIESK